MTRSQLRGNETINLKKEKPGEAGLLTNIFFCQFTSPAW